MSNAALLKQAQKVVDAGYKGTFIGPPKTAPKPQPGKKVWVVECSSQAAGCVNTAEPAVAAAKKMGWQVTLQDGKFTPSVYNQIIRQAVASHDVQGLVLVGINCSDAPAAISSAVAAGIKVVDENGSQCPGSQAVKGLVFPIWTDGKTGVQLEDTTFQRARAEYVILKSGGKANILFVHLSDNPIAQGYTPAFTAAIAKCGGCTIQTLNETTSDFATGKVQADVAAALVKYPHVNTSSLRSMPSTMVVSALPSRRRVNTTWS